MSKKITPKWYIGVLLLVVVLLFFFFAAIPMQMNWGMWGLALTQIGLLLIALAVPILFKWKLGEVLPIKKITAKQFFGTLLLYIASFILVNTVTMITAYFFPGMLEVGNALGNFFTSVPFVMAFIIIAVMPGICEEILFRGVILHTLRTIKNPLIIMLIVGLLFGLFHLDVYRFLPTAILGFVLTYLMLTTGNFLLPVFFHFLNNAVSVTISFGSFGSGAEIDAEAIVGLEEIGLEVIGVYLILLAVAPVLYFFAGRLLNPERKNKKDKFAVIILTVLLFFSGIGLFALNIDLDTILMNVPETVAVSLLSRQ